MKPKVMSVVFVKEKIFH